MQQKCLKLVEFRWQGLWQTLCVHVYLTTGDSGNTHFSESLPVKFIGSLQVVVLVLLYASSPLVSSSLSLWSINHNSVFFDFPWCIVSFSVQCGVRADEKRNNLIQLNLALMKCSNLWPCWYQSCIIDHQKPVCVCVCVCAFEREQESNRKWEIMWDVVWGKSSRAVLHYAVHCYSITEYSTRIKNQNRISVWIHKHRKWMATRQWVYWIGT